MPQANFGKFMFIWKLSALLNGNIHAIAQRAVEGKFQGLLIKFCEGDTIYFPTDFPSWGKNLKKEYVEVFKSYGLSVWGWQFNKGSNPAGEGLTAAQEAKALGLDGVGFDVEATFETQSLTALATRWATATIRTLQEKRRIPGQVVVQSEFEAQANPVDKARVLMQTFKLEAPGMPTAFISFPFYKSPYSGGTWHNKAMYVVFLAECDYGMPMTYWWGSTDANAVWMLENSLAQWREISTKPIVPIGRLYNGDGGSTTATAITAFGTKVLDLGLIGEAWWRMGTGLAVASWWSAVSALEPWNVIPPPAYPPFENLTEQERLKIISDDLKQRGVYPPSL